MERTTDLDEARSCLAERGYDLVDLIGRGTFSSVYTVNDSRYPTDRFCVKIIPIKESPNSKPILSFYQHELDALRSLSHPHIVAVYDHFSSDSYCYMVLEYCENGSMYDYLKQHGRVAPHLLPGFCQMILDATVYLHKHEFCHGDIKPENILLDKYTRPKLADFGFANAFSTRDTMICGSFAYQAPELIRHRVKDRAAADIWALGVTFYQMAVGVLPWTGNCRSAVTVQIEDCDFRFPAGFHPNFVAVVNAMLKYMPEGRETAERLLQMPFFSGAKLGKANSAGSVMPRTALAGAGLRLVGREVSATRRKLPPLPRLLVPYATS
jgi:serine/threonine protein kinase